jgi:hypothetical protein
MRESGANSMNYEDQKRSQKSAVNNRSLPIVECQKVRVADRITSFRPILVNDQDLITYIHLL